MRKPTRLTPFLQVALPGYFIILMVVTWMQGLPSIRGFLAAGRGPQAATLIAIFISASFLTILLAYGSLRRWRWTFWLLLVFLAFSAIYLIQDALLGSTDNLVSNLLGALLFIAGILSLVRFGPWATTKST